MLYDTSQRCSAHEKYGYVQKPRNEMCSGETTNFGERRPGDVNWSSYLWQAIVRNTSHTIPIAEHLPRKADAGLSAHLQASGLFDAPRSVQAARLLHPPHDRAQNAVRGVAGQNAGTAHVLVGQQALGQSVQQHWASQQKRTNYLVGAELSGSGSLKRFRSVQTRDATKGDMILYVKSFRLNIKRETIFHDQSMCDNIQLDIAFKSIKYVIVLDGLTRDGIGKRNRLRRFYCTPKNALLLYMCYIDQCSIIVLS